jgi:3-hydroxyisobutyrate dehydrogenase-like beta-hydroxyacid dehydrogenase
MHLGFIGLGRMGTPMASRLLAAGHELVVSDIDPAATTRLAASGATVAATAAEVADRADLVLTSLPTPEVVREVVLGETGIITGQRINHLVDLSTTGAPTSRLIASQLAERGIATVDAPVSGGVDGASKGTLAVMVACSDVDFALAEQVIAALGKVFHVGREPGLGQAMKLVNNYLSAAALATTSEALVVGTKAGLDPRVMLDVINAGSGRNSATQDKFPRAVLPGTFDFGFATGLMEKDLRLFTEEAAGLQVPLWVGSAVRQLWMQSTHQLGAASDFTTVVQLIESWAGVEVRAGQEARE